MRGDRYGAYNVRNFTHGRDQDFPHCTPPSLLSGSIPNNAVERNTTHRPVISRLGQLRRERNASCGLMLDTGHTFSHHQLDVHYYCSHLPQRYNFPTSNLLAEGSTLDYVVSLHKLFRALFRTAPGRVHTVECTIPRRRSSGR